MKKNVGDYYIDEMLGIRRDVKGQLRKEWRGTKPLRMEPFREQDTPEYKEREKLNKILRGGG